MLAVILALGSAFSYGTSDFLAAISSKRTHFALVSLIAQLTATGCVFVGALVVGGTPGAGMWWGAASGLGSGLGTLALYRGLAYARVSVVAPLSAVVAAALPAAIGLLTGDRPSAFATAGMVAALPAVWLVSTAARSDAEEAPAAGRKRSNGVLDGVAAGIGFALLFIGLGKAGDQSGLWPVSLGQLVSLAPVLLALLLFRDPNRPDPNRADPKLAGGADSDRTGSGHADPGAIGGAGPGSMAAGAGLAVEHRVVVMVGSGVLKWFTPMLVGLFGAAATVLFFYATHAGPLTLVSVLGALYPAITIGLARLVLAEHISRVQGVGLALAALAITLITVG